MSAPGAPNTPVLPVECAPYASGPPVSDLDVLSGRLEGESERDGCTPRRWPGRSGVYMQSADSCKEDPERPALDASVEELQAARRSAEVLISQILPTFSAKGDDRVLSVCVDIVDLVQLAARSTDSRDLNPDRFYRASALSAKRKPTSCDRSSGDASSPRLPLKRIKLGSSPLPDLTQPQSDLLLDALPPAVTYLTRRSGLDGPIAQASGNGGISGDMHFPPLGRNRPPLTKKRQQRMCDLACTARRNLQRTTDVVFPFVTDSLNTMAVPAFESTNVTKSGNHGFIPRWRRDAVRNVFGTPRLVELLEKMQLVHYNFDDESDTAICDRNGRCISFRSKVVADIRSGESLINKLTDEVQLFIANCPISAKDREGNMRGQHFFCIMGIHRQYAQQPYETSFQRKYRQHIDWIMSPGSALSRYTLLLTNLIERRFPSLAQRMLNNAKRHYKHSSIDGKPITPGFGLFWNCCINAPSPEAGIERVVAAPHADSKNVAALFCALLAFWADGLVSEDEWSWLVLWDLGIRRHPSLDTSARSAISLSGPCELYGPPHGKARSQLSVAAPSSAPRTALTLSEVRRLRAQFSRVPRIRLPVSLLLSLSLSLALSSSARSAILLPGPCKFWGTLHSNARSQLAAAEPSSASWTALMLSEVKRLQPEFLRVPPIRLSPALALSFSF
ncbi:hypothetical protein AURDEDRAFT_174617 [Auricularia subglabra TFB-10046 SS5]|uniref:Uncharacterized protein n=1 Tax=Auricularia subglabra (strain TFB-10046 / SS5) TaxID=717982 RepID=J0D958_AURST|nr:hypothetical protein AURDEDRAFT_174617 [Auricularia subglabra TFB-10046 SS5]